MEDNDRVAELSSALSPVWDGTKQKNWTGDVWNLQLPAADWNTHKKRNLSAVDCWSHTFKQHDELINQHIDWEW